MTEDFFSLVFRYFSWSNFCLSLFLQRHVGFEEKERVKKRCDCQKPHQSAQRHSEFWHFREGISTFKP